MLWPASSVLRGCGPQGAAERVQQQPNWLPAGCPASRSTGVFGVPVGHSGPPSCGLARTSMRGADHSCRPARRRAAAGPHLAPGSGPAPPARPAESPPGCTAAVRRRRRPRARPSPIHGDHASKHVLVRRPAVDECHHVVAHFTPPSGRQRTWFPQRGRSGSTGGAGRGGPVALGPSIKRSRLDAGEELPPRRGRPTSPRRSRPYSTIVVRKGSYRAREAPAARRAR